MVPFSKFSLCSIFCTTIPWGAAPALSHLHAMQSTNVQVINCRKSLHLYQCMRAQLVVLAWQWVFQNISTRTSVRVGSESGYVSLLENDARPRNTNPPFCKFLFLHIPGQLSPDSLHLLSLTLHLDVYFCPPDNNRLPDLRAWPWLRWAPDLDRTRRLSVL